MVADEVALQEVRGPVVGGSASPNPPATLQHWEAGRNARAVAPSPSLQADTRIAAKGRGFVGCWRFRRFTGRIAGEPQFFPSNECCPIETDPRLRVWLE
eukprot:scaffold48_cov311-Pinguiococcus_pyrenoidosus.AAC.195